MANQRAIALLTEELRALNLRTQRLEAELRAIRQREVPDEHTNFVKGDRVRITNRVNRPSSWLRPWDTKEIKTERRATVTRSTKDRVWIVTDNGTKTWRAPRNLERTSTL
jgi:hypothetical protein